MSARVNKKHLTDFDEFTQCESADLIKPQDRNARRVPDIDSLIPSRQTSDFQWKLCSSRAPNACLSRPATPAERKKKLHIFLKDRCG